MNTDALLLFGAGTAMVFVVVMTVEGVRTAASRPEPPPAPPGRGPSTPSSTGSRS